MLRAWTLRAIRWTAALSAGVLLILPVSPALAKGEMQPATGRVVINGPGLAEPIASAWQGTCFAFVRYACVSSQQGPSGDGMGAHGPFWSLMDGSNLTTRLSGRGAGGAPPANGVLGPRYDVTYVLTLGGRTQQVVQQLYPFGPGLLAGLAAEGWTYTPPGQVLFDQPIGGGWDVDPGFREALQRRGLPMTAPAPARAPAPAVARPAHHLPGVRVVPAPGPSRTPIARAVALVVAMLALLTAAAAGVLRWFPAHQGRMA